MELGEYLLRKRYRQLLGASGTSLELRRALRGDFDLSSSSATQNDVDWNTDEPREERFEEGLQSHAKTDAELHEDAFDFQGDDGSHHDQGSETTVSSGGPELCVRCGGGDRAKSLMQCCLCGGWIHLECYNILHGQTLSEVPQDDIVCTSDEVCRAGFDRLKEAGDVPATAESIFDQTEVASTISSAFPAFSSDQKEVVTGSAIERFRDNLYALAVNNEMAFASIRIWSETLRGISKSTFSAIVDGISHYLARHGLPLSDMALEKLYQAAPPMRIRRVLESLNPGITHSKVLVTDCPNRAIGVEAFSVLHFRDPIDTAFNMHRSLLLQTSGPYYSWNDPAIKCTTGRLPDYSQKIQAFCDYYDIDAGDPSNIIIPVYMYTDETVSKSGNVKACPLWMVNALIDPTVRELLGVRAHELIALLPVTSSIDFRFKQTSASHPVASRSQARTAAGCDGKKLERLAVKLRVKAFQSIFETIATLEQTGREYVVDGQVKNVRIMVVGIVMDLKERRLVVGLRKNAWHCGLCYDHPGKSISSSTRYGARSTAKDEALRRRFREEKSRVQVDENPDGRKARRKSLPDSKLFEKEYGRYGIHLQDQCPVTSSSQRIFLDSGVSEICPIDLLHVKDGIILSYMRRLALVFGSGFVSESSRFGNEYLGTKRYSTHVMEKGIECFHFVPLAIMLGSFDVEVSTEVRQTFYMGACDLLSILGLLNDPCPNFVIEELRDTIARFQGHSEWLVDWLDAAGHGKQRITTKMHELFVHVIDQICKFGYMPSVSSKIYETFHRDVLEMISDCSSGRIADGIGSKEVLMAMSYRRAIIEVDILKEQSVRRSRMVQASSPWNPDARFEVSTRSEYRHLSSLSDALTHYLVIVTHAVGIPRSVDLQQFVNKLIAGSVKISERSVYGNTLRMRLHCKARDTAASLTDIAVVPGTARGMFGTGGASNVIAYADDRDLPGDGAEKNRCFNQCVSYHHDPHLQLFCSSCRDGNTSYGIPVVFCDNVVYVIPLEPIVPDYRLLPEHDSIIETDCELRSIIGLPYCRVRGVSMMRPHHVSEGRRRRIFVFRYRRVFGYNGL